MIEKNVIALLRVSSASQAAEGKEGLPVQRDDCRRLAELHGLTIVQTVELDGVSGTAVLADPRFTALLSRLREPSIDGVVLSAFDRLFRRGRFGDYEILDSFIDSKTTLYTPQGVYNLRNDSDALLSVINTEISAAERKNIIRRTSAGRERKRREKGWKAEAGNVGVPRGVEFDHKEKQWKYIYPEADRVRRIFEIFLSGETNFAEIARQVGLKGSDSVASVLRQPLYMGVYRVDRRWLGGGRSVPRDPEDCYEHTAFETPLVTPDDFEKVQQRLTEIRGARPKLPKLADRPLAYQGFLDCAECGKPINSQFDHRQNTWVYRCNYRDLVNGKREYCSTGQMTRDKVEAAVGAVLERCLGDPETLLQLIEQGQRSESQVASPDARETERQIAELSNQRRRVMDAYQAGAIEIADLTKRVSGIDGEIAALRSLQNRTERPLEIDTDAIEALADVFVSWTELSRKTQHELLSSMQIRIRYTKIGTTRTSTPAVKSVTLGLLGNAVIYKKMKRLGIQ
ncbi:MAG: recombinase family protein [Myxococcales bacterium]|nr:recombinase family protein [Myxococcales bacterium]